MKKTIFATLFVLLFVFSGCFGGSKDDFVEEVDSGRHAEGVSEGGSWDVSPPPDRGDGEPSSVEDGDDKLSLFVSDEIILEYLDGYTVESSNDGFLRVTVTGENGRIEIFRESEAEESNLMAEVPQDKEHVGRQAYGYDVWLFYQGNEARAAMEAMADTIQVVTTYRNNAHAFDVVFPQDWYFNFEKNDFNCLGAYEFGEINSSEDCHEALIPIYVTDSLESAEAKVEELRGSVPVEEESEFYVGDQKVSKVSFIDGEVPAEVRYYVFDLDGRLGLVFGLMDVSYEDDLEDILLWSFGL